MGCHRSRISIVMLMKKDPFCLRARTFLRNSERHGVATEVNKDTRLMYTEKDKVEAAKSYPYNI